MKKFAFIFVAAIAASFAVSMSSCGETKATDSCDSACCDSACEVVEEAPAADTLAVDSVVADSVVAE